MAFPPRFLDELRSRISLADLIGRRVRLTKRGREYLGLCPFHNEKTPSFTVSEEKGFFHCFGCAAHGDAVEFLRRIEGLSFAEAVERLAGQAGMALPAADPAAAERLERQAGLQLVVEVAATWYESQLAGAAGAAARAYLGRRGLDAATIARFRLGYAPGGRTALKEAMLARGLPERQLVEAGMLVVPDEGATYDRFRDRVMFPITDRQGRVVAFGGRSLGDVKPKYLNSPDTPLFHKGQMLYGLALAREAARSAGTVVVAEGYMDVIALAQAGIGHAVAPLGTALTEEQIALLWRLAPEPVLCFDGDAAGLRAAHRAAERALPGLLPGRSLRFALLPAGEDPDTLVRQSGAEAFRRHLAAALPLAELLWRRETAARPLDTPERQAALQRALEELAGQVGDRSVREYYGRWFRDRLFAAFRDRRRAGGGRRREGGPLGGGVAAVDSAPAILNLPDETSRERVLVLTLVNHPELLERFDEAFAGLDLRAPGLDSLRQAIIQEAARNPVLDVENLKRHLTDSGFAETLDRLAVAASLRFVRPEAAAEEAASGWLHTLALHRRAAALQELRMAEAALAEDMSDENFRRLVAVQRQLAAGAGDEAELNGLGVAGEPAL